MDTSLKYRLESVWIRTRGYLSIVVLLGVIGAVLAAFYALAIAPTTPGTEVTIFGITVSKITIGEMTLAPQTQIVFAAVAVIVCGVGATLRYT